MAQTDVLVVSVDATLGWRAAADELVDSLRRSGATAERVAAEPVGRVRTFALTDFMQARAARRAAQRGITHDPRAIIYCSITAALLWPRPGAISLDSIAAENRPGRHGIWQRTVERRRLRESPLVLAWSGRALDHLEGSRPETIVVPVPVDGSAGSGVERDIAAITYAADPVKRRLPLVLEAWRGARRPGETLLVAGTDTAGPEDGVEVAGRMSADAFRATLQRARAFIAAPRREDYGIAALEALACGCMLVSTPAPGPYPALALASELDPRLVSDDLRRAIRTALDDPSPGYGQRATAMLKPFRREAVDATVRREVLPRLLPGFGAG